MAEQYNMHHLPRFFKNTLYCPNQRYYTILYNMSCFNRNTKELINTKGFIMLGFSVQTSSNMNVVPLFWALLFRVAFMCKHSFTTSVVLKFREVSTFQSWDNRGSCLVVSNFAYIKQGLSQFKRIQWRQRFHWICATSEALLISFLF